MRLQTAGGTDQRAPADVFYSCPSISAEAFFEAASCQLSTLGTETISTDPSVELEQTLEVAQAIQASPV